MTAGDDRGAVAGADALVLGVLVLVVGVFLVVQAWAVVDVRTALDEAAREYVRTYSEAAGADLGERAAEDAARALLRRRRTPLRSLRIAAPPADQFGPCAEITVRVSATVAALRLPFGLRFGAVTARSEQTELVDPHREVRNGSRYDPDRTPCAAV